MSAGTLKIIGWQGDPPYIEAKSPDVENELVDETGLSDANEQIKPSRIYKTLRRTIRCMKSDVQAVVQSLPAENVSISVDVHTPSGTQTVSYGGGWTLRRYTEPPAANKVITEINLVYDKYAALAFEVGLPSGITMTCVDGVGYVTHTPSVGDSSHLLVFDSGKPAVTTGWDYRLFTAFKLPVFDSDSETTTFMEVKGVEITCNGVVVTSVSPKASDFSAILSYAAKKGPVVRQFYDPYWYAVSQLPPNWAGEVPDYEAPHDDPASKAQAYADDLNAKYAKGEYYYGVSHRTATGLYGGYDLLEVIRYDLVVKRINGTLAPQVIWETYAGGVRLKLYDSVTIWDWRIP